MDIMDRSQTPGLAPARPADRRTAVTLARGSLAFHRRVLGLPAGNLDPVRIILAAHLRLRRWRRTNGAEMLVNSSGAQSEIRRLIAAREALLRSVAHRAVRGRIQS